MNDVYGTRTINEIIYNLPTERKFSLYTKRFCRYHVGQIVTFRFGNLHRTGRITTLHSHNGITKYHIETASGTWYREIDQQDILAVVANVKKQYAEA